MTSAQWSAHVAMQWGQLVATLQPGADVVVAERLAAEILCTVMHVTGGANEIPQWLLERAKLTDAAPK